jgi:hypothetical protein
MGSRVRRPETDVLPISGGDTLTVKRFLTAGEFRALMSAVTKPVRLDAATAAAAATAVTKGLDFTLEIDPTESGIATVLAYLIDWTFTDFDGRPLVIRDQPAPVVRAALDAIDAASYLEVQKAIQSHDHVMRAYIAAEKKTTNGATAPAPTSPSVA